MYQYKVKKIKRIIDGDTLDLDIDLGFGITLSQRVRLKGINTAETKTLDLEEKAKGLAAKEWLNAELLKTGKWIIETTKEDKYGRILGTIYFEGTSINQKMIDEKIAAPYLI